MRNSEERAALAGLIQEYLDEQIKSFEFDERLWEFHDSPDPIVHHVAGACLGFFDDSHDHLIAVDKADWDCLQRLLLLLKSNCILRHRRTWVWSWTQLPAFGAAITFVIAATQIEWGFGLLVLAIPFGVISFVLTLARPVKANDASPLFGVMEPFENFSDLAEAYRGSGFQKSRFPLHLMKRRIRSPVADLFLLVQHIAIWLIFSPIILVFQSLPAPSSRTTAQSVVS